MLVSPHPLQKVGDIFQPILSADMLPEVGYKNEQVHEKEGGHCIDKTKQLADLKHVNLRLGILYHHCILN